jgi:hypothetical protein
MSKKIILITLLFFTATFCRAQFLEKNQWNYFEGKIGNESIRLAVFFEGYGVVKGNYCYKNDQKKIPFEGTINKKEINFNQLPAAGKGSFTGNLVSDDNGDSLTGTYNAGGAKKSAQSFKLKLKDYGPGTPGKMYPIFKAPDEDVEAFVKQAEKAILTGDKQWILAHISFPLLWWSNKDWSSYSIEKDQMDSFYPKIFTAHFKEKIKAAYIVNLAHGQYGVKVGNEQNGLITILYKEDRATKVQTFVITSLDCPDEVPVK